MFALSGELWTDGLICAFEFVRGHIKTTSLKTIGPKVEYNNKCTASSSVDESRVDHNPKQGNQPNCSTVADMVPGSYWTPIGWARISELIQTVQTDMGWSSQRSQSLDDEDGITVASVAAPYLELAAGPTWWCHVAASHPFISTWLSNAEWLHPAISIALRDESKLISERMNHLLYEVM